MPSRSRARPNDARLLRTPTSIHLSRVTVDWPYRAIPNETEIRRARDHRADPFRLGELLRHRGLVGRGAHWTDVRRHHADQRLEAAAIRADHRRVLDADDPS